MIPSCEMASRRESRETESRAVVARGWGVLEGGSDCLMGTGFLFEGMKTLWNWIAVMAAQLCEYTQNQGNCTLHKGVFYK